MPEISNSQIYVAERHVTEASGITSTAVGKKGGVWAEVTLQDLTLSVSV